MPNYVNCFKMKTKVKPDRVLYGLASWFIGFLVTSQSDAVNTAGVVLVSCVYQETGPYKIENSFVRARQSTFKIKFVYSYSRIYAHIALC